MAIGAASTLDAGSYVLWSSVNPFHLIRYSSHPCHIHESIIASTSYCSPSCDTLIGCGVSTLCPSIVGSWYGLSLICLFVDQFILHMVVGVSQHSVEIVQLWYVV